MNDKIQKIIEDIFNELDLFNGTLMATLVAKNVFTMKEFNEVKEVMREPVRKKSEEKKKEIEELLKHD